MSIGKLILKNLADGGESKGFMLLVTYNVHKGDAPFSQALLSDGEDTIFAIDGKVNEPNHKYPESNGKSVVYVKLKRTGETYSVENILPADEPSLSGSCNLTVNDFVTTEPSKPEKLKRATISDLAMNDKITISTLITSATTKYGAKKPYVEVCLTDGKSNIFVKDFTNKAEDYPIGKVIDAEIKLDKFGYSMESFSITEKSPMEFIKRSPIDEGLMYEEITETLQDLVGKYGENSIANIALTLYSTNKEKLLYWSASKTMHHDLYGGLLYHTYRMMSLAEKMLETYDNLNEELLLTAVAIHDIGKLVELDTDELGLASYTDEGNLLGHTMIGIEMVDNVAREGSYDAEKVTLLKHCIGSHHGKLEFGAIVLPKVEEAFALHIIDYTDSRIYMFENAYKTLKPGTSADRRDAGLEAVIYRPLFAELKEEEE